MYSLYLEPVAENEIIRLVQSLKEAAAGYDGLSSSILKLSLSHISRPLTYICNLSLVEGVFPDEMKITNVIPLFKCDDQEMFNNYRPVSLLCSLSKVFEKIMYNRLIDFLDKHSLLFSFQFGFMKFHSTYMAIMMMADKLTNYLDNGDFIFGVFLDFSKAFDTVDHDILVRKQSYYGIREMHWHGFRVIWLIESNLLHTTGYLLLLRGLNVVCHKDLFKVHCCF